MTTGAGPDQGADLEDAEGLAMIAADPDGGWLEATPTGNLPGLAERLADLSDRAAAGGRTQEALSASVAAARAYRVLFDQELSGPAGTRGVATTYLNALLRQMRLLVKAGRAAEVQQLNPAIAEVSERLAERRDNAVLAGQRRRYAASEEQRAMLRWAELGALLAKLPPQTSRRAAVIERRLAATSAEERTAPNRPHPRAASSTGSGRLARLPVDQATEFLLTRTGTTEREPAGWLAEQFAGLTQALTLAAGYVAAVPGAGLSEYRDRYTAAAPVLWALGVPPGCPEPLARTCLLSLEHLDGTSRAGLDLLELCAFLDGDAGIPLTWLLAGDALPPALRTAVEEDRGFADAIDTPVALGLLTRDGTQVRIDPLVQAMALNRLGDDAAARREQAALLLLAAFPRMEHGRDADAEPRAALLLPHLERLADALGDADAPLTARLLDLIVLYHVECGQYAEAAGPAERALTIKERILPAESAETVTALHLLTRIRREMGDTERQRAALDRALALEEARYGGGSAHFAHALSQYADALAELGDTEGARAALERAVRIAQAAPDAGPDSQLESLNRLGAVLVDAQDWAAAAGVLRQALLLCERGYGPDDPALLTTLALLGTVLQAQGDLPAARATLERALSIEEACLNPDHPRAWIGRTLLGLLSGPDDQRVVSAVVDRLLDLYIPHLGVAHRDVLTVLDELADLLAGRGDLAQARKVLERIAVTVGDDSAYGPVSLQVLATLDRLAEVQRRQGDMRALAGTLERLATVTERRYGSYHEEVADVLLDLGATMAANGDLGGALPVLQRAMNVISRVHGVAHPKTARFGTEIALVVHRAGDLPRARTLLEIALPLAEKAGDDGQDDVVRVLEALVVVTEGLGDAAAAAAARERLSLIVPKTAEQPQQTEQAAEDGSPPPGDERFTLADLGGLAPGWVERTPEVDLPAMVRRLAALADELEEAKAPEQALRAVSEAVRAERLRVERLPDEELRGVDVPWRPLALLLGRKRRLLEATGRRDETAQVDQEVAALDRRVRAWLPEALAEADRRAAEAERRMAPVRRRSDVSRKASQYVRFADRRRPAIVRRMTAAQTTRPAHADSGPQRVRNLPPPGEYDEPAAPIVAALRAHRIVTLDATSERDHQRAGRLAMTCARAGEHQIAWRVDATTRLTLLHDLRLLVERLDLGVRPPADLKDAAEMVLREFGRRDDWLLIFDDAVHSDYLERFARLGTGHLMIVTTDPAAAALGTLVDIGPPDAGRAERILATAGSGDGSALLAERLGRRPAAVELAARYLRETGDDADTYLAKMPPAPDEASASPGAAVCVLSVERLATTSPPALELLQLCAFLDPRAEIPLDRLAALRELLPEALQAAAESDPGLTGPLEVLSGLGLMVRQGTGGRIPPLVREVMRRRPAPDEAAAWSERAALLVLAAFPYLPNDLDTPADDLDQAARTAPHAIALAGDPTLGDPIPAINLLDRAGWYLARVGETGEAVALLRRAQDLRDETYGPDDHESDDALTRLAALLQRAGDHAAAQALLERRLAARLRTRESGAVSVEAADALHEMAELLDAGDDTQAAGAALERELAIREQVNGPDSIEVGKLLRQLATGHWSARGRQGRARAALERAVLIMEAVHGPYSLQVGHVLEDLLSVLMSQQDLTAATQVIEHRLHIYEEVYGPDSVATANTLEKLAEVCAQSGDLDGARAALTRSVASYERAGSWRYADRTRRALVDILLRSGDAAAGRALYEEIIAGRQKATGPDSDDVVPLLEELVDFARRTQDLDTARSAQERIVAARERSYGPEAP